MAYQTKWTVLKALLALALAFAGSCTEDKTDLAKGSEDGQETVIPLVPDGGMVRFRLEVDKSGLGSVLLGAGHIITEQDQVYVNSAAYQPFIDDDGTAWLEVPESESSVYRMFFRPAGSARWFSDGAGDSPLRSLIVPFSQFYASTVEGLDSYPMYGEYSESTGDRIVFKDVLSALDITIKGSAAVASVNLHSKAGADGGVSRLGGIADYSLPEGYVLENGPDFINLNCTSGGTGVRITSSGKHFYILLPKGDYSEGFTLTVSDMEHKGQTFDIAPFGIEAGEVKSFSFNYSPDPSLYFFEHFDNFVWGANVSGNPDAGAWTPVSVDDSGTLSGYEEDLAVSGASIPGGQIIQANWATVSGWTVGERPSVSKSYVQSRNIADYAYLYRCQEYQGCVSCGAGDEVRGVVQPATFSRLRDGIYDLTVSYDICFRYGTGDTFLAKVSGSGIVTEVTVDGQPVLLDDGLEGNNTYNHSFVNNCTLDRGDLKAPTLPDYSDGWHHVEMRIVNVNEKTSLGLWGADAGNSIKHGFFLDNLEIRAFRHEGPGRKLRVLLFNIQNGMWSDQGNNFDNFVAFVNKYAPDVCVFCESQSIYRTGTSTAVSDSEWQLFTGMRSSRSNTDASSALTDPKWAALAARWGHSYHAISGYRDNYPQVITSSLPIETVKRIVQCSGSGEYVQHGAGHFRVEAFGKTVNIVTCHLWPQKFWPGRNTEASAAAYEGRDFQKIEAQSIMAKTINAYPDQEDWLLMGDTNAISPIDEPYYDYNELYQDIKEKWMYAHRVFRSEDYAHRLYDMIREGAGSPYIGGRFISSTGGGGRIDIMYGSESMRARVTTLATSINDTWSTVTSNPLLDPESESHFSDPSDHRPVYVEFDMSK